MLTIAQIKAAQNNDFGGISAVLNAMEDRIQRLARAAARRMDAYGYSGYEEDFAQDARMELFAALPRFAGETVDTFYGFMWTTIEAALKDKVRAERYDGADPDALKVFGLMVERADGDLTLAERFARTVPPKGKRLGADRARAARLAWQGRASLDAPQATVEGETTRYAAGDGGYVAGYTFAENLSTQYGVPEDLITSEDIASEERRAKHAVVTAILDSMGENQSTVLRYSFGIGDNPCYGHGDTGDDEGLSAALGTTPVKVRDARTKGLKAFAKRYVKAAARSEAEALELTEAAAAQLSRGGRK